MKRLTSLVLIFIFAFTVFLIIPMDSNAASYTTAPDKTEAQVVEKINKLVTLLNGKYFTVNQKKCSSSTCTQWACDNCYNGNVFKATWFKNIFGTVSTSQIPGHAYPGGGGGTPAGWTCHGFANFAMWYVFATNNSNKVSYTRVVDNIKMTKANIDKYLKPGDVIRYNNHSLMFISASASNFTVVDCNYNGDYKVTKHTVPYSSTKTIAVSRAKNYAATPVLSINYNVNGGVISSDKYYVNNSLVYLKSSSTVHTHKMNYGEYVSSGLFNATTFGLTRDGYIFKGWSMAKTGAEIIDQDRGFSAEEIVPDLKNGNKSITLYAIWEPAHTHVYDSSIPFDSVSHMLVCSCGDITYEEHQYEEHGFFIRDDGVVEQMYTCTGCESAYYEVTDDHHMTEWQDDGNGLTHSKHCVCGCDLFHTDYHFMVISEFIGENQGKFTCIDCGGYKIDILEDGLYYVDDNFYYVQNGSLYGGWFEFDGITYYASLSTKVVVNYSKTISGKYYLWNDERGLELADGFVDDGIGIKCYENGVQVIGWHHADGSGPKVENGIFEQYSQSPEGLYYFLSTTGYMVTDPTYKLGGYVREFNDDHTVKPLNGLQDYYGTYYYYVDGVKQTGWHTIDGVTYYFMASDHVFGQAAQRWMYIGNKVYYFYASTSATPYALKTSGSIGGIPYAYHKDGYILYNGFVNCEYANTAPDNTAANIQKKNATTRYYVNGEMQTEWQNINGNWYYFYKIGSANGSGYMCTESRTIGGVWYEFDKNGVCTNK